MEKVEKFKEEKIRTSSLRSENLDSSLRSEIGKSEYINENCWLAKTLNYSPAKRCQYCKLKFRNCLFFQYLITSLVLISFLLALSFLIEREISKLVIISIFVLVIAYGYFFNKTTEKLVEAYFVQKKAKEALKKLTEELEDQVKQRTKELKEAYEKLKKLDKAKSEFISIVSHQFRSPLTAVKGYVSMILEGIYGKIDDRMKEKLTNVYLSNERLLSLVSDLLNISTIEAGKIEMKFEKSDVEDIISSIIAELDVEAEKRENLIKFEKTKQKLPQILIDKDKTRHVIFNIIDNAIKYTEKGEINIKLKEIKPSSDRSSDKIEKIQIIISDNGIGMTEDDIEALFETFSRGKDVSSVNHQGTGLGLYIAKKFIEMQGGKIWAESEGKGKGSTFYIELPIK